MNKKKTLSEILGEKARHLKIDGLVNIFNSNYIVVSSIWLIIFLLSTIIITYLIIESFNQYYEYRVTSTVRYVTEESSVLPTITFCNINPFATKYSLDLLIKANVTLPAKDEEADFWKMYLELEDYFNQTRGYPLTIEEKLKFSDVNVDVPYICASNSDGSPLTNLQTFYHPKYFVCHMFNRLPNYELKYPDDGIIGYLFSGGEKGLMSEMFPVNLKGFYIFISNSSDYMLGTDRTPILLTPRMRTKMSIYRNFYRQAEWPYSACSVREDDSSAVELKDKSIFDEVLAI